MNKIALFIFYVYILSVLRIEFLSESWGYNADDY
jgi:hypothetical protein